MLTSYQTLPLAEMAERFHAVTTVLKPKPVLIAEPKSLVPVVLDDGAVTLLAMRWGLRPEWAARKNSPFLKMEVEVEAILEEVAKNRFRDKQVTYLRCLVPATAFTLVGDKGIEGGFSLKDKPFCFAGIYERWQDSRGIDMSSFAILTVKADPAIKSVAKRMPAILAEGTQARWLDPNFGDWNVLGTFLRSANDIIKL